MITDDKYLMTKRLRNENENENNLCYICNIPYSIKEYRQCKICLRYFHLSCYNSNNYCKYCFLCEDIENDKDKNDHDIPFQKQNNNIETFFTNLHTTYIKDKHLKFQNYLIELGLNEHIRKLFLLNVLNYGLCSNYPNGFDKWIECLQINISYESLMIYYEYFVYLLKINWSCELVFFDNKVINVKYHVIVVEKMKDYVKENKLISKIREIYFKYKNEFFCCPFMEGITFKEKYNGIDNNRIIVMLVSNLCYCCYQKGFLDVNVHVKSKELFNMIQIEKKDKTVSKIENPLNIFYQLFECPNKESINVQYFYKCILYFYNIIYEYLLI